MDIFNTDDLLAILNGTKRLSGFFSAFFKRRNTQISDSNGEITINTKKSQAELAPIVAPRIRGVVMKRQGYSTKKVRPVKIAPIKRLDIDHILQVTYSESVKNRKTPEERADEIIVDDLDTLDASIENRIEWLCAKILTEGSINVIDVENGIDVNIDFNFTNEETLLGDLKWDKETSDPMSDLESWSDEVVQSGNATPTMVILGANVFKAFRKHPKVQSELNVRNMNLGTFIPKLASKGLQYQGEVGGFEIYTFKEKYKDDDGVSKFMMPENKVLLVSEELGSLEFGSVTQMEADGQYYTYEEEKVPKLDIDTKEETREMKITSMVVPVPYDVDAWFVATVL